MPRFARLSRPSRAPVAPPRPIRESPPRLNPYYGYGYRPDWPSILSVAHDEANGGRVFIVTDRPCALNVSSPPQLPFELAGLGLLDVEAVLPIKFHLWFDGPVPRGSAWRWTAEYPAIYDPITGNGLNAAEGFCADVPGPYVPLPPAVVVGASAGGYTAFLTFDRAVPLVGSPSPDDSFLFAGQTAYAVSQYAPNALSFSTSHYVDVGEMWEITRQPEWIGRAVTNPASGEF